MLGNKTLFEILSDQNQAYQNAEVQENSFVLYQEGKYIVEIKNVEIVIIQKQYEDAKMKIKWSFKFKEGQYAGKTITKFSELNEKAHSFLKTDLKICGVTLNHFTDLAKIIETNVLVGLVLNIYIKITEYNGEKRNSVYINNLISSPIPEESIKF